jgi:hypothetical protein
MGYLVTYEHRGVDLIRGGVLIETGTYHGDTLVAAWPRGFARLISIELCPKHIDHTALRLRDLGIDADLVLGSSPERLGSLIDPALPTLFWLDAHFQGHDPEERDPRFGECPLLAELAAIRSADWSVPPYILIDDAIAFIPQARNPALNPDEWPDMESIRAALPAGYTIDVVPEVNCLVCLPESALNTSPPDAEG